MSCVECVVKKVPYENDHLNMGFALFVVSEKHSPVICCCSKATCWKRL